MEQPSAHARHVARHLEADSQQILKTHSCSEDEVVVLIYEQKNVCLWKIYVLKFNVWVFCREIHIKVK